MRFGQLLAELKRRRVFRVAAVYLLAAWLVLQVGDVVVEPLALPPWTMTLLIGLVALGFPVAVALAWAFDITSEGLNTAAESSRGFLRRVRAAVRRRPSAVGRESGATAAMA